MRLLSALAATLFLPAAAAAFEPVTSRDAFVRLVDGKALTRLGISLDVTPGGQISGSAFGATVTGAWDWRGQYFCRDLKYGRRDLGPNCQQVLRKGDTIRFIADRGAGQSADLRLR